MDFDTFANHAADIERTEGDKETITKTAQLLRSAETETATLEAVTRFIQGRVFPALDDRKLGVGRSLCYEALAKATTDATVDDIKEEMAEVGDIGTVASAHSFGAQQSLSSFGSGRETLTVAGVQDEFERMASMEGSGSHGLKKDALYGMFNSCSPTGAKFLARLVLDTMRIGVGERTVTSAIVEAFDVDETAVDKAVQLTNDCGEVARLAVENGTEGLERVSMTIGEPIKPMLAQQAEIETPFQSWDRVTVDWKMDGVRVQAHYDGTNVRLFTRRMEDVTDSLPEVRQAVANNARRPLILDGEVIAIDQDGGVRPFQDVLRRIRREDDIQEMKHTIPVEFHAFDCLYHDGSLLDVPQTERKRVLDEYYEGQTVPSQTVETVEAAHKSKERSIEAGHEGIMLKRPDATYTAGRDGQDWQKVKRETQSLDLVITGGEQGKGKRGGQIGTFHLSIDVGGELQQIARVGTKITEEMLTELNERMEPHIIVRDGQSVRVKPEIVVEIAYDELQRSPQYEPGYTLRWPRVESIRDDKPTSEIDTLEKAKRQANLDA